MSGVPDGVTLRPCYLITHRKHWWSAAKVVDPSDVHWFPEDAERAKPDGRGYSVRRFLINVDSI